MNAIYQMAAVKNIAQIHLAAIDVTVIMVQ